MFIVFEYHSICYTTVYASDERSALIFVKKGQGVLEDFWRRLCRLRVRLKGTLPETQSNLPHIRMFWPTERRMYL